VTRDEANDYARTVYALPEAAALILAAFDVSRSREDRERCLLALDVLTPGANPRLNLPPARVPAPMAGAAAAIGELVCNVIYSGDRSERERVARLLVQVCREAGAIVSRRKVA
jgi:hypothetical protein